MSLEHWKLIYGFVLLAGLILLAFGFGLGKVVEQESYGLKEIIIILSMLAGQWGAWAFKEQTGRSEVKNVYGLTRPAPGGTAPDPQKMGEK